MNRLATSLNYTLLSMLAGLTLLAVSGCRAETPLPTRAVAALVAAEAATTSTAAAVPATWTAVPPNLETVSSASTRLAPPTSTPRDTATVTATFPPSRTPSNTAVPIETAVPTTDLATPPPPPTDTPASTTAPTLPPDPAAITWGSNILPNGSFEEGDYLQNGIPELQLPAGWTLEYDTGPTGFGAEIWDVYVRPEVRVLPQEMLPPPEHPLFIWDGSHTVKAFKGNGAISFRLFRDVYLEPGTYLLEVNVFPDLVMAWSGEQKIWADDPVSGEVRFIAPGASGWIRPSFGRKNTFTYMFTLTKAQNTPIGAGIRGNFAIVNNGWFLDNWSLRRAES
mgnify:CR=1 FL=1